MHEPLDETALLDPTSTYAASKAAADLMIGQMVRDGLRAIRFCPFNHTGPGQTEAFVTPAFAAQIARIEAAQQPPVVRVGNLEALRDFLDVRDVVEAYVQGIVRPNLPSGAIYNIASGVPRRIADILYSLLAQARVAITVEADAARMRPNDTPLAIGSSSRAAVDLGWRPRITWEATLADTLAYWRSKIASEHS
ncbi:GDP-mannose 4,6-dehydratase [Methylobacterium durans]|uniref:GDP-mannose 4,6-dehydratase n=1 Tax=Methylobacterium durans TaxID=2202825 RepID=UPI00202ADC49|nr:GDP-mannose 4,6-dehydratase [Methylobacterium durans]